MRPREEEEERIESPFPSPPPVLPSSPSSSSSLAASEGGGEGAFLLPLFRFLFLRGQSQQQKEWERKEGKGPSPVCVLYYLLHWPTEAGTDGLMHKGMMRSANRAHMFHYNKDMNAEPSSQEKGGRVNVPKTHSCHCAKNSVNAYVVSVPKKDVHVCNEPKFSPAQCWQSAKFSALCCQSAKFIIECSWCQKSTDQASMNSCITLNKTFVHPSTSMDMTSMILSNCLRMAPATSH